MKQQPSLIRHRIFLIGKLTFLELLHEKLLWSAFVFLVLCLGVSVAVSNLNFAESARVTLDFGLTAIALVGGIVSIILGSLMISKDVEEKTAYLVLSKPIARWHYILGRFTGVLFTLMLNSLILFSVICVLYFFNHGTWNINIFLSLFLQLLEFAVLISVASIFSTLSTSAFAAAITSGLWIIGHAMTDLKLIIDKLEPVWLRSPLHIFTWLIPDFSKLNIKTFAAHNLSIGFGFLTLQSLYSIAYIGFALCITCVLFSKKDL